MSAGGTIEVRTCRGEVLQIPPMRLSWATERSRLVDLVDVVKLIITGRWKLEEGKLPSEREVIGVFAEFMAEVGRAAGFDGAKLDFDYMDVRRVYFALRGVEEADPTRGEPTST